MRVRMFALARVIATGLMVCACSARHNADGEAPIAACVSYESALKSCFHRDVAFANQQVLIPNNDADRERIAQLCSENLARIRETCR